MIIKNEKIIKKWSWKNDDKKIKWMKNKLKFGLRQHNWKFGDLIKLLNSLIYQIKGLIEELMSFGT